jgi:hypothetical protein
MRIALIACSKQKQGQPAPARALYTSPWFRLARAWAEQHADGWHILSAKHGLVAPEQVLEPYDQRLRTEDARCSWACEVAEQVGATVPDRAAKLIVLAGRDYARSLVPILRDEGYPVATPLAGLGIGQQMAWLKGKPVQRELVVQGEVQYRKDETPITITVSVIVMGVLDAPDQAAHDALSEVRQRFTPSARDLRWVQPPCVAVLT